MAGCLSNSLIAVEDTIWDVLARDSDLREQSVRHLLDSGLPAKDVLLVFEQHIRRLTISCLPSIVLDEDRNFHICVFGWTKFFKSDIEQIGSWLINYRIKRVLELGCGSGWFVYLLSTWNDHLALSEILAFDSCSAETFASSWSLWPWFSMVRQASLSDALSQSDRGQNGEAGEQVLCLIWPDLDSDFAVQAISGFHGSFLLYVGEEGEESCCASKDFFDLLQDGWRLLERHQKVESFSIVDVALLYQRKTVNQ